MKRKLRITLIAAAALVFIAVFSYRVIKSELFTEEEQKAALNKVMSFFESSRERIFKIQKPVKIDDNYCVAVEAAGKYDNGTYILDAFAIDPKSDLFYYKTPSGEYERFQNTPWYAYSVSPNKKFCIESMNIAGGVHAGNGDHSMGTTRVLDMNTGKALWEDSGCTREKYLWSKNSRYAARQYSGRIWTEAAIIDTETFEVTVLPGSGEILELTHFDTTPASYMYENKINSWLSETVIKVDFGWSNDSGHWIQGSYNYSVPDKSFEVINIEETTRG